MKPQVRRVIHKDTKIEEIQALRTDMERRYNGRSELVKVTDFLGVRSREIRVERDNA